DRLIGGDSDQWSAQDADILAHFQARLPQASDNSPWRVGSLEFDETAGQLILILQGPAGLEPTAYPLDGNFVSAAAPEVTETAQGYQLRFNTARGVAAPDKTDFVVVADGAAWTLANIALNAPADSAAPETQSLIVLI